MTKKKKKGGIESRVELSNRESKLPVSFPGTFTNKNISQFSWKELIQGSHS